MTTICEHFEQRATELQLGHETVLLWGGRGAALNTNRNSRVNTGETKGP